MKISNHKQEPKPKV